MPRRKAQQDVVPVERGVETRAAKRARIASSTSAAAPVCAWPSAVEALRDRNLLTLVLAYDGKTYDDEWKLVRQDLVERGEVRRAVARQPQYQFHLRPTTEMRPDQLLVEVCIAGHLDAAKWVQETFAHPTSELSLVGSAVFRHACSTGRLALAQWLVLTYPVLAENDCKLAFRQACQYGHLPTAQWLHVAFSLTATDVRYMHCELVRLTCDHGHVAVLQWLHATFVLTADDIAAHNHYAVRWACINGHLSVLQWLHTTFTIPTDIVVAYFPQVCHSGHLDLAQWIQATFIFRPRDIRHASTIAFRNACLGGHVAVAKWLHTICSIDLFEATRDDDVIFRTACARNHLALIEWFHATFYRDGNQPSPKTITMALIHACTHGHLAVAQWLHTVFAYTEHDVKHAYKDKLGRGMFHWTCLEGHLSVAQWLYTTFRFTAADAHLVYHTTVDRLKRRSPIGQWLRQLFRAVVV